ncbi:MAG: CoA pyrophosphatase [Betaproteobacteria bacterium]|nr:CoA pyrophosphatase [Betaproteobacteria bacterium]
MLTRNELARMLAAEAAAGGFSDDGDLPHPRPAVELTPAAVLIGVLNRAEPTVLFTQRTAHLNDHAGQISFPGGRRDPGDRDAAHTALRETEEETGLAAHRIEVIGRIPDYTTGTGFLVTPVVGWVETPPAPSEYSHDAFEVAEVFEVPLAFLLDPTNHRRETAMFKGRMRSYHAVPWQGRYIWGATAGMLLSFYRAVTGAAGRSVEVPVAAPLDSG